MPEVTEDRILGGKIAIRQPAHGYRVNVDTILLAAAVAPAATLMEAGTGVGAAALVVAHRHRDARLVAIERDSVLAELARENVAQNDMSARVRIEEGDVLSRAHDWGVFDGVFFNPPFALEHEGRAPAEERRGSHITEASIEAWIVSLADRLRGGAVLTLIHRAEKLAEITAALDGRLGGVEILPVRPTKTEPAKRVLVRARKGSRAPLKLLRGIDLHDDSGAKHTPEIEAVLRGEAGITWS